MITLNIDNFMTKKRRFCVILTMIFLVIVFMIIAVTAIPQFALKFDGYDYCTNGSLLAMKSGFCEEFDFDKTSMPWRGFANEMIPLNHAIWVKIKGVPYPDLSEGA